MSFGSTIKRLRKERSLTQDQLANLLNVTPQAVSRWETNAAMPDISLLIPLANVFNVSTDTLLEVDVQKNEEHIREFSIHYMTFMDPYGKTLKEKLSIYRDEVRKYPNCAQLKEALIGVINFECELQGAFPDPALYREMANLTEDIIALGGGKHGLSYHRHQLVYYSEKLKNPVRAAEIAETAPEMEACKEVLLPSSLSGREQIDARKNLIFKCTDLLINTIYALYGENASDLTEDEWEALRSTENVVATMYGHDFSNHFVLARNLYSAVHGALKRGNQAEAINRLQQVAEKLSALETETAPRNPLVLEAQFDDLCMALHVAFSIKMESMLIIERMLKDFGPENVPALRRENEQFDIICATLDRLMDSDGGQVKKDCWAAYHKIRNIVKEE